VLDLCLKRTAVSIFFILKLSFNLIKESLENLYKCYLTYVGKPAQLCFDVIELQALDKTQQEVFLRFYFYALNVKKVVFLQQINGFSWDYNVKHFFLSNRRFLCPCYMHLNQVIVLRVIKSFTLKYYASFKMMNFGVS
jgi:hypothetical protein